MKGWRSYFTHISLFRQVDVYAKMHYNYKVEIIMEVI